MKKRSYKRQSVNDVNVQKLRDRAVACGDAGTCVGLDVAKHEIVVCLRWPDGWFERPWRVKNPSEIGVLIGLLLELKEICGSLTIGIESTGTYGDVVRCAMTAAFLEVHRVSGKAVSDYKEIFFCWLDLVDGPKIYHHFPTKSRAKPTDALEIDSEVRVLTSHRHLGVAWST